MKIKSEYSFHNPTAINCGARGVHERREPSIGRGSRAACVKSQWAVGVRGLLFAPLFAEAKSGKKTNGMFFIIKPNYFKVASKKI
ncbi:MAG: hypothetical protein NT126_04790 [Bacteroidetes bacterium]|nr:hypothetical protein [Bacteroidota bacterium]